MKTITWLLLYLLLINLLAFVTAAFDKWAAKRRGMRRIPERTLLTLAAFGGSAGLYAAMRLLRHKTKHRKFTIGVPLIFFAQLALAAGLFALANGINL